MGTSDQGQRLTRSDELRSIISEERLVAFFRAALDSAYPPASVKEFYRILNAGEGCHKVWKHLEAAEGRYQLTIDRSGPDRYEISFGSTGSELDDGGSWSVEFDEDHTVISIEQPGYWVGRRSIS